MVKEVSFKNISILHLALKVSSSQKHQLKTSLRFISARQRYVCYILNEIADKDTIDCI